MRDAVEAQDEAAEEEEIIRFIPIKEVAERVGLSTSTVRRIAESGEFPAPVQITQSRSAWVLSEVIAWQRSVIERRNGVPDK